VHLSYGVLETWASGPHCTVRAVETRVYIVYSNVSLSGFCLQLFQPRRCSHWLGTQGFYPCNNEFILFSLSPLRSVQIWFYLEPQTYLHATLYTPVPSHLVLLSEWSSPWPPSPEATNLVMEGWKRTHPNGIFYPMCYATEGIFILVRSLTPTFGRLALAPLGDFLITQYTWARVRVFTLSSEYASHKQQQ
jgi:hypothetical protein